MGAKRAAAGDDDAPAMPKRHERNAEREAECRGTLRALNEQFASWISRRAIEHPIASWGTGCEDYLRHLDRIRVRMGAMRSRRARAARGGVGLTDERGLADAAQADFRDVLERDEDATEVAAPAVSAPAVSASVSAPAVKAANDPFGSGGSIFGAMKPAASLFGAPPPAGSIFGTLPVAPGGGFGGLGGGNKSENAGEDDDDEDEPPRPSSPSYKPNEATEDEHETVLLRVGKVKFHVKKDASEPNWADRGVNSFEFRREKAPSEGGVKRCRLLMRNTIGKAVLNAGLYAKMSSTLTEKKNKDGSVVKNGLMFTAFNAEDDNAKTLVYLRFGKESDAKELHKLIAEHVAEL